MRTSCLSLQHLIQITLIFIALLNPRLISVYCLKNNNVSGFHNINLIQSKRQPLISKNFKLKQNVEKFHLVSVTNCSDKRCECCNYLLINDHCAFKNVQIKFKLKRRYTCDSFNLVLPLVCSAAQVESGLLGTSRVGL